MLVNRAAIIGTALLCAIVFDGAGGLPLIAAQQAETAVIQNSSFKDWNEGLPVGWTASVGATNGSDQPLSKIEQGDGPSLRLSGDASTMAWQMVQQTLKLKPGATYRLTYSAKAANLQRQGRQRNNCCVGLFVTEKSGKFMIHEFWPVGSKEFQEERKLFKYPENVAKLDLGIFLSMTGEHSVKELRFECRQS